jgi:DNA-binding transcriptional MerR regulator
VPTDTPKASGAFRTIGELANETGLAPHILRYWETRFPQLRPLTRAGNRRYYRPDDVALVRRIDTLLNREGYTVRGVQQLLARKEPAAVAPIADAAPSADGDLIDALRAIRELLAGALADDRR